MEKMRAEVIRLVSSLDNEYIMKKIWTFIRVWLE